MTARNADTGQTPQEAAADVVGTAARQATAADDPTYAAFLQAQGLRIGEVEDEIELRKKLFKEDSRRRSLTYQHATDRARQGINTDFENRGLTLSGVHDKKQAESARNIGYELSDANYNAQRQFDDAQRALQQRQNEYQRQKGEQQAAAQARIAQNEIQDAVQ